MQIKQANAQFVLFALLSKHFSTTTEMFCLSNEYDFDQSDEHLELTNDPLLTSSLTYKIDRTYAPINDSDDRDNPKNEDEDIYLDDASLQTEEEDATVAIKLCSTGKNATKRKSLVNGLKANMGSKKMRTSSDNTKHSNDKVHKSRFCEVNTKQHLITDSSGNVDVESTLDDETDELNTLDIIGLERYRRIAETKDSSYRFHVDNIEKHIIPGRKSLACEIRNPHLNNLFKHVRSIKELKNLEQVVSYAKYKQEVICCLNVVIQRYEVGLSALDYKQELVLFNIWLNANNAASKRFILGCLYCKLTVLNNLASNSKKFTNKLFASLKDNSLRPFPDPQDSCSPLPHEHDTRSQANMQINHENIVEAFFAKYLKCKTIPEDLTASKFYDKFKCTILLISADNGSRVFNPRYKKLLRYYPELLVYADWRIDKTNLIASKEDLVIEIQYLYALIISYIECTDEVINNVRKLRKHIDFLIRNYVFMGKNKTHLYCFAMYLEYDYKKSELQCMKTNDIVFILSFIAKDKVYDFSVQKLLKEPFIENIMQSMSLGKEKRRKLDLEFILSLQILIEYYNYIGLCRSRKLLIFPWNTQTLVISYCEGIVQVELFSNPTVYVLLYDELMHDIQEQ